ncbi:transcriptional regulator SplA [Pullulanibacillus camelliae]|uniref:Transcriptional regulator SplA n=1 Tax=Pullulanibacillus camelliae TaxID=1707096 RepID=A0A8J2YKP7_9BACL|nr:transcriptional regulator SplA domain-containing protein [Pullulanibacillus camelliae]GGE48474.1 transcriptional regulator SplA [Pullulanibacillus camelliae]
MSNQSYRAGEVVYVMYRNPHAQSVANVQEAAVVEDPDHPGELCLFIYDTYYPLSEEIAIYQTKEEAEAVYQEYFGDDQEEDVHG